jgi:diguanylate cyclase (GGDEF)-like protein
LGNRLADEEVADVREHGGSLTLLLLSLRGLRGVNDAFGYKVGDRVLAEVAGRLQRVMDELGMLCRIAGDEFICLLRNYDHALAINLGERAQTAVEMLALEARPGQFARVKLGFAVAEYLVDGETLDDLLHAAVVATRHRKSTSKLVEIVRVQAETRLAS